DGFRDFHGKIMKNKCDHCSVSCWHFHYVFKCPPHSAGASGCIINAEKIILQSLNDNDKNGICDCCFPYTKQHNRQSVISRIHESSCKNRRAFDLGFPLENFCEYFI